MDNDLQPTIVRFELMQNFQDSLILINVKITI